MPNANTGLELLRTFVPHHLQRLLASRHGLQVSPFQATVDGAVLVADIVGFTALAEAFEIAYNEGADQLSELLGDLFGFLSQIVEGNGGEVVHLAGDGLLAIWPVEDETDLGDAVRSCIAAALEIQQRATDRSTGDLQPIRMRVGVGAGPIWIPVVGGQRGRTFALTGGQPLDQIARALDAARPGDVIVAREAAAIAGDALTGSTTPHGLIKAEAVVATPFHGPTGAPALNETTLESFVPETVAARAVAGMASRFAEIRQASTVFVKVGGLGTSSEQRLDEVHQVTTSFQEAVGTFDGTVAVMLLDESGLSMIGTWGGSGHAHEDDAARALRAAMAFTSATSDLAVGVGIASGRIYFGDVGTDRLRRFTVLGRPVNLAARLATSESAALIRCDGATMAAARRSIAFEEHPPVHLKGILEPIRTFRPVVAIESVRGEASPMVGRGREREVLGRLFDEFLGGSGATIFIEGEPGIGKSTLVRDLLRASEAHPVRRLILRGSPLDQATPYHPWRAVFSSLLGNRNLGAVLDEILEPYERGAMGLLTGILPAVTSGEDRQAEMSPVDRIETTRRVLARLFSKLVRGAPLLLILEDAHWYDTATWALAEAVIAHRPDALVVCATRGITDPPDPTETRLRRDTAALRLHSLTPDETVALACDRLDVPSIPRDLAGLIQNRTEGHPFFTEELLRSLRDSGVIEIVGAGREVSIDKLALDSLAVPSSVAAIIATRIDRLPLAQQNTLKVASVVGRSFTTSDIEAIHPESLSAAEIKDHLEAAAAMELIASSDQGPAGEYRFSHILTAEATYGLLPADARASMHRALARTLAGRADTPHSLLAHHLRAGGDVEAAATEFDHAARAAFDSGAPREVLDLLGRRDELGVIDPSPLAAARREAMRGEAYIRLGDLERGHPHLLSAVEKAGMPMPGTSWRLAGGLLVQLLRQVRHRFTDPRPLAGEAAESAEIGSAAYWAMTATTFGHEDQLGLAYVGIRATNEAERIPATRTLALGYSFISYATGLIGLEGLSARYHQRAMAAAGAAGSPAAAAEVGLNRAVMFTAVGRWNQAATVLTEAAEELRRIGSRSDRARALAVKAYVLYHSGQFDDAKVLWTEAATVGAENDLIRVWAATGHARVSVRTGRRTEAISILVSNRQLVDDVGELASQVARLGFYALALWHEGRLDAAIESARAGLEAVEGTEAFASPHAFDGIAEVARVLLAAHDFSRDEPSRDLAERAVRSLERVGRRLPIARPRASMGRAMLLARQAKRPAAARRFRRALQLADRLAMPYERALILQEMGHVLGDVEALARSTVEFSALGAVEAGRPAGTAHPEG
jgi:class 3 adenylate cyclase/tetratricopeptide (TPR) repeat protein/predicted ATPase